MYNVQRNRKVCLRDSLLRAISSCLNIDISCIAHHHHLSSSPMRKAISFPFTFSLPVAINCSFSRTVFRGSHHHWCNLLFLCSLFNLSLELLKRLYQARNI